MAEFSKKIVILSGAGLSAESGVPTFRDLGGVWNDYNIEEVASPDGWHRNPETVLEFYNKRRKDLAGVNPNLAHCAIAKLEEKYNVVVITQNVDNLHERAGSSHVLHVHGELTKARSTVDDNYVIDIGTSAIEIGDKCPKNGQLRPHIVWFNELIFNYEESIEHIQSADKILVVGTSLQVFPFASFVNEVQQHADKVVANLEEPNLSFLNYHWEQGLATKTVPLITNQWLEEA